MGHQVITRVLGSAQSQQRGPGAPAHRPLVWHGLPSMQVFRLTQQESPNSGLCWSVPLCLPLVPHLIQPKGSASSAFHVAAGQGQATCPKGTGPEPMAGELGRGTPDWTRQPGLGTGPLGVSCFHSSARPSGQGGPQDSKPPGQRPPRTGHTRTAPYQDSDPPGQGPTGQCPTMTAPPPGQGPTGQHPIRTATPQDKAPQDSAPQGQHPPRTGHPRTAPYQDSAPQDSALSGQRPPRTESYQDSVLPGQRPHQDSAPPGQHPPQDSHVGCGALMCRPGSERQHHSNSRGGQRAPARTGDMKPQISAAAGPLASCCLDS